MTYRGLTWDHPRGYDALAAAAARFPGIIRWDKQPLEGFESAPITDLTAQYDLIVLDHPHIGEAVVENCLIPLENLYPTETLTTWEAQSIGPSFASYRWDARHYALPLDVATHVMAHRPDMVPAPTSWEMIENIAKTRPVALSLGGPHALLKLISVAAGEGHVAGGPDFLPDAVALPVLDRLGRLARNAPPGTANLNPIQLLERMTHSDDIALIPLIFGYVTYARGPRPIRFTNTLRTDAGRGGVLGGTGICFSRNTQPSQDLLDHIAWLMQPDTQRGFIPDHGGQPSACVAWADPQVNAAWGDFYANTRATAETALLRPRFDGFPAFTNRASAALRQGFADGTRPDPLLTTLRALWRDARAAARGDLDDERHRTQ
ncbi:MAG: carbohydrate ABC transporter substrate-binding protein [Pseudomonadota bacterium]